MNQSGVHIIVADDWTGAADSAVHYCGRYTNVLVVSAQHSIAEVADSCPEVLSLCTSTRHLDTDAAAAAVVRLCRQIRTLRVSSIFKKIDSCLRGNIGAEIDAMVDYLGYRASCIAPALPEMGRITRNNIHYVDGAPLRESHILGDVRSRIQTSSLSEAVQSTSMFKVAHVELNYVDAGEDALGKRIDDLIDCGFRHVTVDATDDSHLEILAHTLRKRKSDILPVGSAGLSRVLARSQGWQPAVSEKRRKSGRVLFVCGSASRIMAEQIHFLCTTSSIPVVQFSVTDLEDVSRQSRSAEEILGERISPQSAESAIVCIGSGKLEKSEPSIIIDGFARVTEKLMYRLRPASLFLSGGDTAESVLHRLGAYGMVLTEESFPGIVGGAVCGGEWSGLAVWTKAGAFGSSSDLSRLYEYIA